MIQDNGQGMSEAYQRVIFDPFTRELNSTPNGIQGTGLGMAITKNIVEMMGGEITVTSEKVSWPMAARMRRAVSMPLISGIITVTSEKGKGSEFRVELSLKLQNVEKCRSWWCWPPAQRARRCV